MSSIFLKIFPKHSKNVYNFVQVYFTQIEIHPKKGWKNYNTVHIQQRKVVVLMSTACITSFIFSYVGGSFPRLLRLLYDVFGRTSHQCAVGLRLLLLRRFYKHRFKKVKTGFTKSKCKTQVYLFLILR